MGVKDLWSILTPFCERRPLYELQGKKVAIDLSGWVCEAQNITDYTIQPRMYLRNLYFRTCYLLLMDVNVVFVLDGKAPELKYKTIAARNALQFKGAKPRKEGVRVGKDRSRFNHTLKQCEEMLNLMGIACVKGGGEAEALCAYLNEDGLVDGIISQDSDCFAYGAQTVYRNFSISSQGNNTAKGGSIDVYNITKVYEGLNFGRNKIIALALLCGSDYCDGVYGIGKDSALKLFNKIDDEKILDRLRSWRGNADFYEKMERKISNKNICTCCGHFGKVQMHTKRGCIDCGSVQGCDLTKFKDERLEIKNELNIRSKALMDPEFPDQGLIDEFLLKKTNVSELNLKWKRPDLIGFIHFTLKFLTWEEIYAFEKFLPILTRWQLLHQEQAKTENGTVAPRFIKKRRHPKGVAGYEIVWEDKNNCFKNVIPREQLEESDLEKLWSTIEPQNLVEKAYPDLVHEFEKCRKPKRKKKSAVDEIDVLMKNCSITPIAKKKSKKPQKTLDYFIRKSTPKKKDISFDINQSKFGDEDDLDISDIVENIINRKVPNYVEKLGFKLDENKINCSFFVNELTENDLFEKTFKEYCNSSSDENDVAESY